MAAWSPLRHHHLRPRAPPCHRPAARPYRRDTGLLVAAARGGRCCCQPRPRGRLRRGHSRRRAAGGADRRPLASHGECVRRAAPNARPAPPRAARSRPALHAARRRAAIGDRRATGCDAKQTAPRGAARRERRQARYDEMARRRREGVPIRRIARRLGMARNAGRRWLRAGAAPVYRRAPGSSALDRHRAYGERRWAEGCRNSAQLWRELRDRGFAGGYGIVRRWAIRRRGRDAAAGDRECPLPSWRVPSDDARRDADARRPPGCRHAHRSLVRDPHRSGSRQ